jgi:hypothetical protein
MKTWLSFTRRIVATGYKSITPRQSKQRLGNDTHTHTGLTFHKADGYGGLKIKRIKPNSAAAAASHVLCPGLRVLSLDGVPLDGITTARQLAALTQVVCVSYVCGV